MKIRNYCSGSSNSDGMKNWLLSTFFVGTHILSAQSSDTLSTATILAEGLDFSESRTVVDSTQLGLLDIATYLQKDSRFQIRQYAPGSIATLNLGGANSAQSRVVWEGIDISSMASGVIDLSLVPSVLLPKNGISSGANAALGSESGMIGGLDLSWRASGKSFFTTAFGANSIGLRSFVVQNGGEFAGVRYRSFIKTEQSDNAYPYTLGSNDFTMRGMEYSTLTVLQRYQGKVGRVQWNTNIWYTEGTKNSRGSVLTAGNLNHLEDRSVRGLFAAQKRDVKATLFYGKEWQAYTDTASFLNLRDTNTYDQVSLRLAKDHKRYTSNVVASYVRGAGTSRNASLIQMNASHLQRFGEHISVLGKASYWNETGFGGAQVNWTGKNHLGNHHLTAGTFYRLPTINELYWTPGGNPDLLAERSYGAKYSLAKKWEDVSLFVSTDQLYFTNLIQWTPGVNGFWSPENIEQAYTSTSSIIGSYHYGSWFNEVSLTHQYSRILEAVISGNEGTSLLYRPDFNAVYTIVYDAGAFNTQLRTHYVGQRHTLRDNSPLGTIPSELWMDLSVTTKILKKLRLLATVHNVTGAQRNFFLNYPLPGRYYSLTLQLNSKS